MACQVDQIKTYQQFKEKIDEIWCSMKSYCCKGLILLRQLHKLQNSVLLLTTFLSYCNMVTAKPPTIIVWHITTTNFEAGAYTP